MLKKILLSIVLLAIAAYLMAAITVFNRKPATQVCNDIRLVIKDSVYAGFITKKEVSNLLKKKGLSPLNQPLEQVHTQAIEQALEQWQQTHPDDYIAVLVNNAGIRRDNLMVFMQNEEWHQVIDTTLNGFFYLTRRLLKEMMTHRWGRIVNMASLSGIKGLAGQTNYSAAKAALIGATKALAQEVAPRKITVNAIAPGFIETDMTKELNQTELKKMIPAGRFGKPEEVAALTAFLVSDDAAYITGETISINGGLYT